MASYTPNYNLKKSADSDSYDISDANGNMDIIDGALNTLNNQIGTYNMGSISSLEGLQTAITTYANGSAMVDNQSKNFVFTPTFASNYFVANSTYFGTVVRVTQNRFSIIIQNHGDVKNIVRAVDANGTWSWDKFALSDEIVTQTIETSTTKIIRKTGNIVTLILKDFEVSAVTITGFIPSGCRPQATVYSVIESIENSNQTYFGRIEIAASGACSFFAVKTYGGSLVSAVNTKVSGTIAWAV